MKPIGPAFSNELKTAGLLGLPFAWGDDGDILFDPRMTEKQIEQVLAVYEKHDPAAPAPPTQAELDRIALKEKLNAAVNDGTIAKPLQDVFVALLKVNKKPEKSEPEKSDTSAVSVDPPSNK